MSMSVTKLFFFSRDCFVVYLAVFTGFFTSIISFYFLLGLGTYFHNEFDAIVQILTFEKYIGRGILKCCVNIRSVSKITNISYSRLITVNK